MKTYFFKTKHYWKDDETATWNSAKEFDDKLLDVLKSKYSDLVNSRDKFIEVDGKLLLLFYVESKDIFDRPLVEIAAFYSQTVFKDPEQVYRLLSSRINDVFDEQLVYEMEIDKSWVRYNRNWMIYLSIFILTALLLYILRPEDENVHTLDMSKTPKEISKTNVIVDKKTKLKSSIKEQNQKHKSWKWTKFCTTTNSVENPTRCYESYIQKKCQKQEDFHQSYLDFIKTNASSPNCILVNEIKSAEDDKDIPNKLINNYEDFFKGAN